MSHLSDLTLELAEKSNFCNRYLELCSRYSESLLMDTTDLRQRYPRSLANITKKVVDTKLVKSILNEFGYPYKYFGGEKFYRIYLLKRTEYEVWFHLQLYKNSLFDGYLDPHIYIQYNGKYFAGGTFPCIFEGAGGVKPTKYMLRPAYTGEVLPELIKELIDLAFSYVYEFEELKEG